MIVGDEDKQRDEGDIKCNHIAENHGEALSDGQFELVISFLRG